MSRSSRFPVLASILFASSCVAGGCAQTPFAARSDVRSKLAAVGLELISEDEAAVPPAERGRYLPCQVRGDVPPRARPLPAHPAGYLLVGVGGKRAASAAAIREALAAWAPGERLKVVVRRNPYLGPRNEWWEREVTLVLPDR